MAVCQLGQPIPDSIFCSRFIESVRMMACVICASRWVASHCIVCVTASTSMVRLEVVALRVPLSSCTVLPPLFLSSYLSRSLADCWGTTLDFTTSFLHSSWFSAFHSIIFHSRPVHSLMLSSHRFLCLPLHLPP